MQTFRRVKIAEEALAQAETNLKAALPAAANLNALKLAVVACKQGLLAAQQTRTTELGQATADHDFAVEPLLSQLGSIAVKARKRPRVVEYDSDADSDFLPEDEDDESDSDEPSESDSDGSSESDSDEPSESDSDEPSDSDMECSEESEPEESDAMMKSLDVLEAEVDYHEFIDEDLDKDELEEVAEDDPPELDLSDPWTWGPRRVARHFIELVPETQSTLDQLLFRHALMNEYVKVSDGKNAPFRLSTKPKLCRYAIGRVDKQIPTRLHRLISFTSTAFGESLSASV